MSENSENIPPRFSRWQLVVLLSVFLGYLTVMICSSWLADDAYITLRTVDNFVNGYGLRWNISERVQTYTHALWMMTLVPVYFVTKSHYYTPLIVSWVCSIITAITIIFVIPKSFRNALIIGLIMIFSKAYVDYSTSGLENPLTNLLLVGFFLVWMNEDGGGWRNFGLGLLAGLLALNRHDAILLVAPALAWEILSKRSVHQIATMSIGMTPFILWELFSLAYYGFPFPNTAYAKLNTAASTHHLFMNGWYYIFHTIRFDPLTIGAIVAAAAATVILCAWKGRMIAFGGILYSIYITWAGGDFMSGRFFVAPLVLSLLAIATIDIGPLPRKKYGIILAGIIIGGMIIRNPTMLAGPNYGKRGDISAHVQYQGVNDERSFYYQATGLLARRGNERWPDHTWRDIGEEVVEKKETVHEFYSIGFLGFFTGRNVHVIDILGLGDPLLSRITHLGVRRNDVAYHTPWGTNVSQGHYERAVPAGYKETVRTGVNVIEDPNLNEYYDHLKLVISGPIWTRERWRAIWQLNTGGMDELLDRYENPSKYEPAK